LEQCRWRPALTIDLMSFRHLDLDLLQRPSSAELVLYRRQPHRHHRRQGLPRQGPRRGVQGQHVGLQPRKHPADLGRLNCHCRCPDSPSPSSNLPIILRPRTLLHLLPYRTVAPFPRLVLRFSLYLFAPASLARLPLSLLHMPFRPPRSPRSRTVDKD
jgi:hypothetical protein